MNSAIGFLDHSQKLGPFPGRFPLDKLIWPLGQPAKLRGQSLRDLEAIDHLVLPPRTTNYFRPSFGTKAKVSIMVLEPRIVQQRHIARLRRFYRRFESILTFYPELLDLPNARFLPFGSTWIPDWRNLEIKKTKNISLIASARRTQPGHHIRHSIVAWARDQGVELEALETGLIASK